jgi:aminoglycoside phosphotransferase (APT) family kinase protein
VSDHDISIDGDVVTKRYTRTDRGEPQREWAALVLLHELAPGLAPEPLARETDPPVVVMSRVPGVHIETPLSPEQLAATIAAYRALFAVPVPPETPRRFFHPAAFLDSITAWLEEERTRTDLPVVVRAALAAAGSWLADPPPGIDEIRDPVIAQGDGKVDNALFDGSRVRLVDFEGFGVGDVAFEVADLAEHISSRLYGVRDPAALVAGFDLDDGQRQRVGDYRVVLATFWLLQLLPGNRAAGRNPAGSASVQALHLLDLLGGRLPDASAPDDMRP